MATASWARAAVILAACAAGGAWPGGDVRANEPSTQPAGAAPTTRPVDAKPLSDNVNKGLAWLVQHQLPSGAWGQGDESAQMQRSRRPEASGSEAPQDAPADPGNVADTCAAVLAMTRAGSTASKGPHAKQIAKAADYICAQVE